MFEREEKVDNVGYWFVEETSVNEYLNADIHSF